jgi:hypothetical protein
LETNSKIQLAQICLEKQFALGFLNAPSIKTFKNDGTKYTTNGVFDTSKLLTGGDRTNNTGSSYSLVTDSDGATNVVYLAPWVSVFENGRNYIVPPASYIGQVYMRKFNNNNLVIWDALAGVVRSQIPTINGLEVLFSDDELNDMNNFGLTAITNFRDPNNFQNQIFYLFNEKTAVSEDSVLRFIHNREALIELELSLYKGLRQLQWNFILVVDDKTQENVEQVANDICEYYLLNNAIQSYTNQFVVNNTYVDAQVAVLNTQITLSGVLQTILLEISVLKTGGVSILVGENQTQ